MDLLLSKDLEQYVEENRETAVKLIDAICRIPAPSNLEEKRAAFVLDWLRAHGCEGVYLDDAWNVIYPYHCEAGKDLILISAHTDTVFPDLEPFTVQYEGDKMSCPGVGDDTANLVVLMLLAAWAAKSGRSPKHGILFAANSGEEGLGNLKGIRQIMRDFEGKITAHISLDGTYESICNRAVGSVRYQVRVHTEGGHSYGKFGNLNAIQVLSSLINTLYTYKVPAQGKNTYNVGMVQGGTSVNTIAQCAEMLFEYRSDVRESLAAMEKFFQKTLDCYRSMDKVQIDCALLGERPCNGEIDAERQTRLEEKARHIVETFSQKKVDFRSASTDCNIALSLGIPAVCFGCYLGEGAHTREESLSISSLKAGMKIAAAMVENWFSE